MSVTDAYWLYWDEKDKQDLEKSTTFEEHLQIALRIIKRMPRPIGIVCGPISTGGKGTLKENMEVFNETIEMLRGEGKIIFSQTPFEDKILEIKEMPYYKGGTHLLEAFYLPLFELQEITTFYFIRGWGTSEGASWEHRQATRLNKRIIDL